MSYTNSTGDFSLDILKLRKGLEFPNGSIQETAYTGSGGIPTLEEVLVAGDNADGLSIMNVNVLEAKVVDISSGSTAQALSVSSTSSGTTGIPVAQFNDATTGQSIRMIPSATDNTLNPMVQAADSVVGLDSASGVITLADETTMGIRMNSSGASGAGTLTIGSGGVDATNPSNRIVFANTGTLEYGTSHQFVNGVARYDAAGQATKLIPSAPSTSATVIPSFEILEAKITGDASDVSATLTLQHNITATTNYAVFPSIYYGYTGSGGTYNALDTSTAMKSIVISDITSTEFTYNFQKSTGNNVNIYINFLVVYQMPNTTYAKTYS